VDLIEDIIASTGAVARPVLDACMVSPSTTSKLQEDISYAQLYRIEGTPLVVLNGKKVLPVPEFLYAMALAEANPDAKPFSKLPYPAPARVQ
jgi:hypothetical protein